MIPTTTSTTEVDSAYCSENTKSEMGSTEDTTIHSQDRDKSNEDELHTKSQENGTVTGAVFDGGESSQMSIMDIGSLDKRVCALEIISNFMNPYYRKEGDGKLPHIPAHAPKPPSDSTSDSTSDKSEKCNKPEEAKHLETEPSYKALYQVDYMMLNSDDEPVVFETEPGEEPTGSRPNGGAQEETPTKIYPIEVHYRYMVSNPRLFTGFQKLRSTLTINSPFLINALQTITDNHTLLALLRKNVFQIEEPYQPLAFHLEELRTYRNDNKDDSDIETTADHIDILLEFLDKSIGSELKAEAELNSREVPLVSWNWLWTLFRPGTLVITKDTIPTAYIVRKVVGGSLPPPSSPEPTPYIHRRYRQRAVIPTHSKKNSKRYIISCWALEFDGFQWKRKMVHFSIARFTDPQEITSLTIYPLDILKGPRKADLMETLVKRGKMISKVHNESPSHKEFNGWTLDYQPREIQSRVVIDHECYLKGERRLDTEGHPFGYSDSEDSDDGMLKPTAPKNKRQSQHPRYDRFSAYDMIPKGEALDDLQLCLLSQKVIGWVLKDRKWAHLGITDVTDIIPDKNIFDSLILPQDRTDIIKALVQSHKRTGLGATQAYQQPLHNSINTDIPYAADAIKGKGQGLLILLHGPPGVGKTSTAECVAEYTERPLFPITCGDLGTTSTTLEKNLDESFQLAQRWGAVLLLDEADVFLERRGVSDIKRNSLVSVFLRILEYYTGILFLTTNRVGSFDEAFTSRLHVSIYYPPLDISERKRIWRYHVKRVERVRRDLEVRESVRDYLEHNKDINNIAFNGRQIRNIFQTAVSLAFYEAKSENSGNRPSLTSDHLRKVVNLSREFQQYLNDTRESDSSLAKDDALRNDNFAKAKPKSEKGRDHDGY